MNWTTERFPVADSTNRICKQRAEEGAPEGYTVIADRQTQGRGRLGRSFFSPDAAGLYMSFLLRPAFSPLLYGHLTPLAAVAVCRALKREGAFSPQIKWVNDVYLGEKKLCGILTQTCIDKDGKQWAIVGIGVNLIRPKEGFPEELSSIACALYDTHPDPKSLRTRMADRIREEFAPLYADPLSKDTLEEYRRLCFLPGRQVTVHRGEEQFPATVLAVDDDYQLKVKEADGRIRLLNSGEVSLKL